MSGEIDRVLGRRLRRRRQLLGLTLQEVADACGFTFQQVQKYETAVNRMSAVALGRLSRALGVEAGYFFEGMDDLWEDRGVAATPIVHAPRLASMQ